jgi:hypothetical protein
MATSGGVWGTCVDVEVVCRCPWGTPLPALYWTTDKVGGPESKSVTTGKPISSVFTSWKAYLICLNPSGLPCLAHQAVFSSSGPHVRSGRPTDRSVGLLVGRTHLSGTAVSLVGGDPGVPMSLKPRLTCRRSGRDEVMSKRSEVMVPLRSCRVHGDQKRKTPPMHVRSRTSSFWSVGPGGRSEDETPILKSRRPDPDQVTQRSFCDGLMLKCTTMETPGGL